MAKKNKQRKQTPGNATPNPSKGVQDQKAFYLAVALQTAVPLRVYTLYERGGPTSLERERSQQVWHDFAVHGEQLLFERVREGEIAQRFYEVAQALAVMAFDDGGSPTLSGHSFDARSILSGFIGTEKAAAHCQQVLSTWREADEVQAEVSGR